FLEALQRPVEQRIAPELGVEQASTRTEVAERAQRLASTSKDSRRTRLTEGLAALDAALAKDRLDHWRQVAEATKKANGFELAPQSGLAPCGPDPGSGLQEFYVVGTGEAPQRSAKGIIEPDESMALVLVLIPAGRLVMGASEDDELADPTEKPQQ